MRSRNHPPTPRSVFVFIHPDHLDLCVHPPFSSLLSAFVSPLLAFCLPPLSLLSSLFSVVCVCVFLRVLGRCVDGFGGGMCSSVREVPLLSAGSSPSPSVQEKASRWGGRRVAISLLRIVYAPPVYHAELLLTQAARPAYLLPTAQWVDTNAAGVSSGEAAGKLCYLCNIQSAFGICSRTCKPCSDFL
jgi:hypothetical protein